MTPVSLLRGFALGAGALLCVHGFSYAADHRDAPRITFSPALDINDLYMFRSPADASKLVMIMTTHPLGLPDFAASYPYQPGAVYRFNFSTNAQATPTAKIDFVFSAPGPAGQTFTAFFPRGIKVTGQVTRANATSATPNAPVVNEGPQGIKIFAGPREDPFFFDLAGFNRFVGGVGDFRGVDSFSGLNTNAIVVEFPISLVAGNAQAFSAWGVTFLAKKDGDEGSGRHDAPGQLGQADRNGNPAVNTAFIPPQLKDAFNRGQPERDDADFGDVIRQAVAASPNAALIAAVAIPDTLKFELSQPDGFPNGRRPSDDVIQTLFSLLLGSPGQLSGIDDGVASNDKPFSGSFPYLAPPNQPVFAP